MPATVRLNDIVDALEMQFDESSSFLDRATGQVETVSHFLLREAEKSGDGEEPDVPTWQKQEWEIAKRIVSSDHFQRLPTKFEVHEWAIMQDCTPYDASRSRDIVRRMADQWSCRREPCTIGALQYSSWCSHYLTTPIVWCLLFVEASVGTLFSENLTRYVNSTESEAIITLFPGQRAPYRIPRSIYGTFLEHIGQSVFGGVSAQLLDNPSLEPYPASPENINKHFSAAVFRQSTRFNLPLPWLPLRSAGRRYELRSGNAANSASFLYVMGLPDREVGIRQPVYLPLERELAYRGVLFASAAEGAVALSVSFRRHDHPDDILAESTLQVPNHREWVKLSFQLKLPAGAVAPLETVDFAVAVKDDGRVSLDEIPN